MDAVSNDPPEAASMFSHTRWDQLGIGIGIGIRIGIGIFKRVGYGTGDVGRKESECRMGQAKASIS